MKKKVLIISLAALLFLLALGLTLYPLIANRYHQRHQSESHTAYQEQVAQADKTEIIAAREKAIAYNETLVSGVQSDDAWMTIFPIWRKCRRGSGNWSIYQSKCFPL